jgi:uncharacterized RDD family membrane protein YckC
MEDHSFVPMKPADDTVVHAGFWIRAAASVVDGIIVSTLVCLFSGYSWSAYYAATNRQVVMAGMPYVAPGSFFVSIMVSWLYMALLESSPWQATVGKKLFGLYVTDLKGRRISFRKATARYFGKFLSTLFFGFGFLMIGFTAKKQGLHDKIANTYVMHRIEAEA